MSAPTSRAKGTKAAGARRGRVGRNQYSKDLFEDDAGLLSRSSSPGGTTKRPQRSRAGSSYRTSGLANGVGINGHEFGGGTYRPRSKQVNLNRLSMNEMKKRVAAIGDFVALSSGSSVGGAGVGVVTPASTGSSSNGNGGGGSGSKGGQSVDGAGDQGSASKGALAGTGPMVDLEKFREMSTEQMKEVMMGAVEGWQTQFGKWGER